LYIAMAFNPSGVAGFKGQRATLHLQIDSDEHPDEDVSVQCGEEPLSIVNAFPTGPLVVDYAYYRPPAPGAAAGTWDPLNVLGDETQGWTRSGVIRFEVPMEIGPIPTAAFAEVESGLKHPLVGAL